MAQNNISFSTALTMSAAKTVIENRKNIGQKIHKRHLIIRSSVFTTTLVLVDEELEDHLLFQEIVLWRKGDPKTVRKQ